MGMKELLIILGVAGIWYALQRWILPRLGIET
jgi:hypothetical protein